LKDYLFNFRHRTIILKIDFLADWKRFNNYRTG